MIIYDTMRVVIVKVHSQYSPSFIYDHIEDKHNRWKLPVIRFTNTLAIRCTKELNIKRNIFVKFQKKHCTVEVMFCLNMWR